MRHVSGRASRSGRGRTVRTLTTATSAISTLTLSIMPPVLAALSGPGTIIGSVLGARNDSTVLLVADSGGRFVLDGFTLKAGATTTLGSDVSFTVILRELFSQGTGYADTSFTVGIVAAEGPATDPAITGLRADGWSADMTSPPTMQPETTPRYVVLDRPGFTSSGTPTTHRDNVVLTRRVRLPAPNNATLDASRVALSSHAYAGDVIVGSGAANNSPLASPKPTANWALPDRRIVGNSLRLEVVAFHRNARAREQVACVVFTVTDGTTTINQTVSASSVLGHAGDRNAVVGYAATIDISTLANVQITANAKVYPWIGGAGAVLDSADGAAGSRDFRPHIYRKNPTLAATPWLIYVAVSGGDDVNAVVSTDAAMAKAAPAATVAGAIARLRAQVAGNRIDGCEVRLMAGTHVLSAVAFNTYITDCAVVVTRDPDSARAACILSYGSAATAWQCPYVHFRDVSMVRTGTSALNITTFYIMENVNLDNASQNTQMSNGNARGYLLGVTITNLSQLTLTGAATTGYNMLRGIDGGTLGTTTLNPQIEQWLVLGCHLRGAVFSAGAKAATRSIIGFNRMMGLAGSSIPLPLGVSENVEGFALIQNVFEWSGTTLTASFRPSGDSNTGNITNMLVHHNTFAGFWAYGRGNILYDETSGTLRTHTLNSFKGNLHTQINYKSDIFAQANALPTPELRTGTWSYNFGVDCEGEVALYRDAGAGGFSQDYPGLRSVIGTSDTVPLTAAFSDYRGTTSGPTVSAGGGTYSIGAGSIAAARLANPVLRFDVTGVVREVAPQAAGAYRLAT
jgi:hypothetical protein